jgi:uncharacterized membrane protein YeaQ/YmgE (transglycosylase-associated protein family)
MNIWTFEYADMRAVDIAAWIVIATLAGHLARRIVQGKPLGGLWGDLVIGLVSAFTVGTLLRRFGFDLSQIVLDALRGSGADEPTESRRMFAIWVDVFLAGFVGSLIVRMVLRIAKQ